MRRPYGPAILMAIAESPNEYLDRLYSDPYMSSSDRIDELKDIEHEIIKKLEAEEETNLVIKMNAGKANENIKHSKETIDELDEYLGVKELSFTKSNSYVNI